MAERLQRAWRWVSVGAGSAAVVLALLIGVALVVPGCGVGYLCRQSTAHLRVLAAREPVAEAIAAGKVPAEWLPRLETLADAKRFGAVELGLPTETLYETISLAPVGPTWIVTACPKDSLEPVTWWFPIVGRVAYKGDYDREAAEKLAAQLREEGNDVQLYPASAFSSLGWFDDPIRPSMLEGDDADIANLVLHESTHRVLYWKGETDFNESFATFVGDVGAIRYLEVRFGAGCEPCRRAAAARADAPRFADLIERTLTRLRALYGEPVTRDEKLRRREEVFAWAREEHGRIAWEGEAYAGFAKRTLDNAVLLSYRRYGSGQDRFDAVLARCEGDLARAIAFVRHSGWPDLSRAARHATPPFDYLGQKLDRGEPCPAVPRIP